jgi:transposase-like protein
MNECRFCGSYNIIKNGIVWQKQRYKCKECKRTFTNAKRNEYGKEIKLKMIKSYLNGVGFRQISRIFDIPLSAVIYIIKKIALKLEEVKKKEVLKDKDIIEVLEADELFTYVKKSQNITLKKKHLKENL